MRYLLVFLVVLLLAWRWRSARTTLRQRNAQRQPSEKDIPMDMVCCAQCGVHTPSGNAFTGEQGVYCSLDHQRQAEP